ncbi:hypothetical protein GCM10012275_57380 [Longimycelium tulufanense]|uniref:Uncharacterized protein n=1 Tax=Longimycelium tulufanense TaxID=907463 RepID=A0A8J3FY54_9PSEU|nr:hypothetical protein [Longimycelium tulufanense]GGM79329.1 hypothetical protein GCM10012275_57380 [Longimycelium tulufanense]
MGTRRTSAQVKARELARKRKAELDAQRQERERKIEDLMVAFMEARLIRDEALSTVTASEQRMAQAMAELHQLGETTARIRELLDIADDSEYARLRKVAPIPKRTRTKSAAKQEQTTVEPAADTAKPAVEMASPTVAPLPSGGGLGEQEAAAG